MYWAADSEVALYLYSGPPFEGIFRLKMGPFPAPLHTPAPPEAAARRLIYRKLLGFRTLSPRPPRVGAHRGAWSPPHPPKGRWPLPTVDSGALPASQPTVDMTLNASVSPSPAARGAPPRVDPGNKPNVAPGGPAASANPRPPSRTASASARRGQWHWHWPPLSGTSLPAPVVYTLDTGRLD